MGGTRRSDSSRHRALSDDERALWDAVAKEARPLRKKAAAVKAAPKTIAAAAAPDKPVAIKPIKPVAKMHAAKAAPAIEKKPPKASALDRRERSRIARGHYALEARLDLHGMTQAEAHRALIAFVRRAHHDGARRVLVITGKGRSGEGERGVLRRQVPHWLTTGELSGVVIGFEAAHIGHGGDGALYVRLRKSRS